MNEIRDLIIGIDFGKEFSQISYYDRKAAEPLSVSMKVGSSQFEAPSILCRRIEQDDFCIGLEARYFGKEKGGVLVEKLYEICEKEEAVQVAGVYYEPWELLAHFLKGMMRFLGIVDIVKNTKCVVMTSRNLNSVQVQNFQKAFEELKFPAEKVMLMDYCESFYYYTMTQKRETWNRSIGWYDFKGDKVVFRKLSLNSVTRPVLVRISDPVETELGEEEQRDEDFCKFIKETLQKELFSSIQITGEGFDQSWAENSVKLLCFQKRKVYFGNNLFAKGACAAGVERLENKALKAYRYLSNSLVLVDVGMEMRVMGSPTYHPLIEAETNWYESKSHCEFILDRVKELVFVVSAMGRSEKKRIAMELKDLPERPNKTTRISLDLEFESAKKCRITAKDLGFGEMFPSSGKIWEEVTAWGDVDIEDLGKPEILIKKEEAKVSELEVSLEKELQEKEKNTVRLDDLWEKSGLAKAISRRVDGM